MTAVVLPTFGWSASIEKRSGVLLVVTGAKLLVNIDVKQPQTDCLLTMYYYLFLHVSVMTKLLYFSSNLQHCSI